jgi:hypothetical protein
MNRLYGRDFFRHLTARPLSCQFAAVRSPRAPEKASRIRVDQPPEGVSQEQNSSRASISRLLDINYRSQVESFHRIVSRPDGQSLLDRLEAELQSEQRHDELKQLRLMVSDIPFLMYLPSVSGRAEEEPEPASVPSADAIKSSNERRLALQQLPQSFTAYLGHLFKDMDHGQLDSFISSIAPEHLRKLERLYRDVLAFGNYSAHEIPKRYSEISAKMDLLQAELQQVTSRFSLAHLSYSSPMSSPAIAEKEESSSGSSSQPAGDFPLDPNVDARIGREGAPQDPARTFLDWRPKGHTRRKGSLFRS